MYIEHYFGGLKEAFTEKQIFVRGEGKKQMKSVFQCMCCEEPVFTDHSAYTALTDLQILNK